MEPLRRGSRDRRDRRAGDDSATTPRPRSLSDDDDDGTSWSSGGGGGREPAERQQDDDAMTTATAEYLPGARHPLHATPSNDDDGPEAPVVRRSTSRPRNRLRELAVMDLPWGVVVFPGDSLPLRVRGPWERHLSSEIETQRLHPSLCEDDVVQFGVLTKGNVDLEFMMRRSFGSLSRQSWTRQAWGPQRLGRYSFRLAQELQRLADSSSSEDDEGEDDGAEAARRERGQGGGSDASDRVDDGNEGDAVGSVASGGGGDGGADGGGDGGHSRSSGDDSDASSTIPNLEPIDSVPEFQPFAPAPPLPQHVVRDDSPVADPPPGRHDPTRRRRPPGDGDGDGDHSMIGRIGTLVTVLYTHGDDLSRPGDQPLGSSSVWRQHGHELIITARGTGRFRVVQAAPSAESGASAGAAAGAVRRYLVEELIEEEMSRPSLGGPPAIDTIRILAQTTPIPKYVWRNAWPDYLASQIRHGLNQSPSHRSLVRSMRDGPARGPLRLSYWLSSNMALQQHEKVALLEMMSPVERLRWILRRLKDAEQSETVLQCKRCGCPITRGSHAFSVGGAQGTTGNYVNEYGHVHQTMTFYSVDEDEVSYTGSAETRDSWFPGYSWTIMNCGFCQSHLGWKFRLVDDGEPATEDRPTSFFGLSTGQVASIVPDVARVRRRGSLRH